eukprot:tig00000836_g4696.t1
MAHLSEGKTEQARGYYERALEIQEKVFGADHPETASTLLLLADVNKQDGKYDEAEVFYKRCIDIRRAKLGMANLDTAGAINDLGELYLVMGRYPEAEPLFIESRTITAEHSKNISRAMSRDDSAVAARGSLVAESGSGVLDPGQAASRRSSAAP